MVIDLDLPGPAGPPTPPRAARRRWWVPVLLVALLVPVPSGGPVTPPAPVVVLDGDGIGDLRADGDALVLMLRTAVAAYRMPAGDRRWSVPVEAGTQLVTAAGGRVVVAGPSALVGLDAATGAEVWRRDGLQATAASTGGVLIARAGERLLGLDLGTGAVRWELATPSFRRVLAGAGGRVEIADLDAGGTLRIRDAATAAVTRTVSLPDLGAIDGFDISGERLLAYSFERSTLLNTAVFDLTSGRRLWRHTTMAAGGGLWWCGALLCTGSVGRTTVVDPDTGAERWSLSGWADLGPFDAGHMWATVPTPNAADPAVGAVVVDAATGRIVRRFGAWDVVAALPGRAVLVTGRNPGGSLIARLDLDTGAVTVLGRTEHWPAAPQCIATATLVACHRERVSVWRT
ncbi:PQQ-binding-like beta-propeller repeat protein [Dactylosporangium sp. NPDC051541]|uniref:outer membrane protein assembly factor BamB family protein n=1 Tax=Dactylosporangium sp. NPDC051541 TaxID=3363977 RepID=UPI00379AF7B3